MAEDRVVLLDENTANRIAAGEVVERPASAVKELVENAIDAGASRISILLEEGGKRRIVVTDDGFGMTRSDAILSLQRHATSKIRCADDLFAVRTLGFRGEALPSIASVSRFQVTTKPADSDHGLRITVDGGEIQTIDEVAARDGTTIEVSDLFFNTPARLKFLKSTPAEVGRAMEVVSHLAIACPNISFQMRQPSHEMLTSPGTGEPLAALAAVWGRDIARKLAPIRMETPGIVVYGHIATPDISRTGRTHELFFVNGRPIKSRLLSHALEDAFRSLTPDSRYPIAAIFIDIEPALVDVNVHPTKTEVKFTRDGDLHHAVSQAVKRALSTYGIVPTARVSVPEIESTSQQAGFVFPPGDDAFRQGSYQAAAEPGISRERPIVPFDSARETGDRLSGIAEFAAAVDSAPLLSTVGTPIGDSEDMPLKERPAPRPFADQLREFRVLGQARNTYIIALTPDGIAVIDQHVAHERVLYERLTVKRFSDGIPVQRLLTPVTLNLTRREALLLGEHCESFASSGWDIAPFGGESFVIRAVPAMLQNKPYEQILRDMIEELVNHTVSRRLLVQRDHVTITNACKMAVKAGDPLSIEEMTALLQQLAETENPYVCPHGRPIVVKIGLNELDKQFKRA